MVQFFLAHPVHVDPFKFKRQAANRKMSKISCCVM